jgi:hypothetical protein
VVHKVKYGKVTLLGVHSLCLIGNVGKPDFPKWYQSISWQPYRVLISFSWEDVHGKVKMTNIDRLKVLKSSYFQELRKLTYIKQSKKIFTKTLTTKLFLGYFFLLVSKPNVYKVPASLFFGIYYNSPQSFSLMKKGFHSIIFLATLCRTYL